MITENAYAKINLYLDVLSKTENGYHNIESVMQTISLFDKITLDVLEGDFNIEIKTNASIPTDEGNLVYKACKSYLDYAKKKRKIKSIQNKYVFTIEKNIPVSAGMGGGSSDCAAALKLMNEAHNNILKEIELLEIGSSIGADVAFCLTGGTAECRGIGDKIKRKFF